ncbi:MAG: hypothetical protein K6T88_06400 [Bacillus sp. (in: Bacteria)]|nr:hypothetical protein [Bacillus sp. (in: firmicutes)]
MNRELKSLLDNIFQMRNVSKINRTKLNNLIDSIKTEVNKIENEVIEYVPVTFTLKNQKVVTINSTLEQLCDFEDWLVCNQWAIEKWKREKFVFDDVVENKYKEIFRDSIRYIEWPAYMEINSKLVQGKWFVDTKKPIVKSNNHPLVGRR